MKNYRKLLIIEKHRFFIDVAYRGCGSGCKYCYVPSAAEKQQLASYEDLTKIVMLLNQPDTTTSSIISFCPNTEPFKSSESTERVLFILESLREHRFHIQISTKEHINDALLVKLNALAAKNAIFLNISMPVLSPAQVEPGSATIEERISNLDRMQHCSNLKCGLYIKPCYEIAVNNMEQYIAIINSAKPDYVCIGPAFTGNKESPCATLHHPTDAALLIPAQKNLINKFSEQLRTSIECPVVYSSICAIFQTMQCRCSLDLWQYDESLCRSCGLFLNMNNSFR